MIRHIAASLLPVVFAFAGCTARAQGDPPQTNSADLQKFDASLAFLRARNARDYALASANAIDQARYVEIGGIQQWITIRGDDRNNPVLLFLHGGPGDAINPWAYAGFGGWSKHFTLVQWDQRGAGRTFGKNSGAPSGSVTVARMTQDGIELAELLRRELGKDKLLLVGHSFGSILSIFMVKARPELFHAFVGTGQVADPRRNYAVAYSTLLQKAQTLGNQQAIRELREIGSPPYANGRGYGIQRKWSNRFEGADLFLPSTLGLALTAPGYTVRDVNDWFDGQGFSAEQLVPETSALEAQALGGRFALPVFVIQGVEDFTTPTSLARSFVTGIHAPQKAFIPIAGGGHFAVFMRSQEFLGQLVSLVRPLATH
jgi:pimeloyl-ACP methyl ester carboxylesterase